MAAGKAGGGRTYPGKVENSDEAQTLSYCR